jgi:phosphoribosylformimino-5-aminoimidazole carboxamide ribotide isomerase
MELWAAVDLLGGSVVTLTEGRESSKTSWKESAEDLAERWEREGADGLHVIDLDAAFGKGSNRGTVLSIVRGAGVPVQVGGGVRSREAAEELLEAGASRVILGTVAYSEPETLSGLLKSHGAERIVVAADYAPDGRVMTRGWTSSQDFTVAEAAERLEAAGVLNLLVTAVGKDGTARGPDVSTMKALCSSRRRMRLMASGGIRHVGDLKALAKAGASGAVIGRALYDGGVKLRNAKSELAGGKR